jgi:hypothetical protein
MNCLHTGGGTPRLALAALPSRESQGNRQPVRVAKEKGSVKGEADLHLESQLVDTHAHTYTHLHPHAHTHAHTYTYKHNVTYILAHTHAHTYTYKHNLTYILTHTGGHPAETGDRGWQSSLLLPRVRVCVCECVCVCVCVSCVMCVCVHAYTLCHLCVLVFVLLHCSYTVVTLHDHTHLMQEEANRFLTHVNVYYNTSVTPLYSTLTQSEHRCNIRRRQIKSSNGARRSRRNNWRS